jgi:hypothetical protein
MLKFDGLPGATGALVQPEAANAGMRRGYRSEPLVRSA